MHDWINTAGGLMPVVLASVMPGLPDAPSGMYYAFIVLVGAAALLAAANQAIVFFKNFREQPPPAQTYATKKEVEKLENDLRKCIEQIGLEFREISSEFRAVSRDQETRASKIHSRVDQVLAAVSRLEGKIEGMQK